METKTRISKAESLRDEARQFAHILLKLRNSVHDAAREEDKVRVQALGLPQFNDTVLSGAARFKPCGGVQALGVRQSERGSSAGLELTFRTMRNEKAIVKKTVRSVGKNYAVVATAWFRADGRVIRYQEEQRPTSTSA